MQLFQRVANVSSSTQIPPAAVRSRSSYPCQGICAKFYATTRSCVRAVDHSGIELSVTLSSNLQEGASEEAATQQQLQHESARPDSKSTQQTSIRPEHARPAWDDSGDNHPLALAGLQGSHQQKQQQSSTISSTSTEQHVDVDTEHESLLQELQTKAKDQPYQEEQTGAAARP